jgi:hypothetical protein
MSSTVVLVNSIKTVAAKQKIEGLGATNSQTPIKNSYEYFHVQNKFSALFGVTLYGQY